MFYLTKSSLLSLSSLSHRESKATLIVSLWALPLKGINWQPHATHPVFIGVMLYRMLYIIFPVYRIISRIFYPDGIRAPSQQRQNSYSAFSAIIGKKFPFLMRCSGFTVLFNIGPLLFQASESSGVFDGISSSHSAPHIVLELSVT